MLLKESPCWCQAGTK